MDFLLGHWHCLVPLAVIGIVLLVLQAGKKSEGRKK
jgi:hypothetical protein